MRNCIKSLLLIFTLAAPAFADDISVRPEQDVYKLACKISEICFEQTLKNAKHNFTIEPGSTVRVEVVAKNGATVQIVTGGATMSSSYLQVGTNTPVRQKVVLEALIDESGGFLVNVETAKVTINGVTQNGPDQIYTLKIKRVGNVKDGASGMAI